MPSHLETFHITVMEPDQGVLHDHVSIHHGRDVCQAIAPQVLSISISRYAVLRVQKLVILHELINV